MKHLKSLVLVAYKCTSLEDFQRLRLDRFVGVRGKLECVRLQAREATFQSCAKLRDFAGSRISELELELCHQVALDTLPDIEGLQRLSISGMRGATDLAWVKRCRSLRHLAIYDARHLDLDISGLASSTLREAFLPVEDALVRAASRAIPGAAISNGDTWFRGGKPGVGSDPLGY